MQAVAIAYALGFLIPYSTALQVTPNSPCSSLCADPAGNTTDPNSFGTTNADITCLDSDYPTTQAGQRFESCLTCLQSSTFSSGSESDQLWFLYNLRYAFDNCIFGFPNATGGSSSPCSTSTACGSLQPALEEGNLDPNSEAYSFCNVDGSDLTQSNSITKCLGCVAATDNENFLANFLVALQVGCEQQPAVGSTIALNGTVFAETRVGATNSSGNGSNSGVTLSTAAVIGLVIGGLVLLGAITGIIFICYRKRRNRRVRLGLGGSAGSKRRGHRPASSLSFRCQTHVTPRSAGFPNISESTIEEAEEEEKNYGGAHMALGSHPFVSESPVSKHSAGGWPAPSSKSDDPSFSKPSNASKSLKSINTSPPTVPSNVYYSSSPKASHPSPLDPTPVSTISTAQLLPLRTYNPAEYGVGSPNLGGSTDGSTFTSPTSGTTASPLLGCVWEQNQRQNGKAMSPVWEMPHRELEVSRPAFTRPRVAGALERMGIPPSPGKGRRSSNTGSPVESQEINIHFAAPPSRR
ncbi:hypothetical protein F5Y16DRAFT_396764 [Xylariaceae sp. FL0255]|nr:hypothetical protein F5Y16DRAFT_396764 [Xylariaceae sp. FL0255]